MSRKQGVPAYCLHKATGQAVVRLNGRDVYLGKYDTAESKEKYGRVIAEWNAGGKSLPPESLAKVLTGLTVAELILAYFKHAETYYRKDGKPTRHTELHDRAADPACDAKTGEQSGHGARHAQQQQDQRHAIRLRLVLHDNVRIHLDDVKGLGRFLEFEAIVNDSCDEAQAQAKLEQLRRVFEISDDAILSQSYSDLTIVGERP